MTFEEFDRGMNRLKDVFGDRIYSDERMKIIWRFVKDQSGEWMIKTVDYFVGYCRQGPLLPEWLEEISKERERLEQIRKREYKHQEMKEFIPTYACDRCEGKGFYFDTEYGGMTVCNCRKL